MEDQLHYIDNFFLGLLSDEEAKSFEDRIISDPAFAADVAFYVSSRQAARELIEEDKKLRYRELFGSSNGFHKEKQIGKVRKMWYVAGAAMAAAIVTAVIVGVFFLGNPSIQEVAQTYVTKNYHELSIKMGPEDEVQKGLELYNLHQYAQALSVFESALRTDSSFSVLRYAGLSALNIPDYDKALKYFRQMENYPSQFSNPAVFLQAVTYMERNRPGDKEQARQLLEKVRKDNLEGKEKADEWIKQFGK
jgi:tetratricopeptide (TPR) repeat protein